MFTKPDDLPDQVLAAGLRDGWRFAVASLDYQAVGFGSHHWLAGDESGNRWFATVDDLAAKTRTTLEDTDFAFGQLSAAFATAWSLRHDSGLEFVVAPIPAADGRVLHRLTERYSLVVHPVLDGTHAGDHGEFTSDADRHVVIGMLAEIHRAPASAAISEDFVVPNLDSLLAIMSETSGSWDTGPFAERARELVQARAGELELLIEAYGVLAGRVAERPERMVVTHGEPHAGNVVVTPAGLVMVDWDTALRAAPERDLWSLAERDKSLLARYSSATGVEIDEDALALYRLWYDLVEIGGYLRLFRAPHGLTADTEESWLNLRHFLRPAERWPSLVQCHPIHPDLRLNSR